ncbi:meiotic recombination protein REC114 isoform X2 [Myripristis murdjan]|uniref:meiotic recombination protein REC114 isoform X2 n=1 Tax=Myripristis murdjan TaxID=586833 RepID=UPI0011762281|nr:meiotic recombination protein REC114 isoform X2 [Myripristis murdjan]
MTTGQTWRLARFGRFVPCFKEKGGRQWKVIEADDGKSEIVLTIVESGQLLVSQGHDFLDGISLLGASDFLKVHQKSDNLIFRYTVKAKSRLMRMQFGGSSRAEAIKACSNAVVKLMEYLPVTTQDGITTPNQPPSEITAPLMQTGQGEPVEVEPEIVRGSLSIKRLSQVHHHCSLPQGNLEPFLRVCLLDPSFPAFVEEVEGELKKLLQD